MNKENLAIHFNVRDFNTWRTSYDGCENNRGSLGGTRCRWDEFLYWWDLIEFFEQGAERIGR